MEWLEALSFSDESDYRIGLYFLWPCDNADVYQLAVKFLKVFSGPQFSRECDNSDGHLTDARLLYEQLFRGKRISFPSITICDSVINPPCTLPKEGGYLCLLWT